MQWKNIFKKCIRINPFSLKKDLIEKNCAKLNFSQGNLCTLMKTENGTKFLQSYDKGDNENKKLKKKI